MPNVVMDNGRTPSIGQTVIVVGNCHPDLLGTIATVERVEDYWCEISYTDDKGEKLFAGGKNVLLSPYISRLHELYPDKSSD